MVAEEREQFIDIRVHIIHCQRVIYTRQTAAPEITVILQCLTNSLFRREIHHGRQVRIKAVEVLCTALPISDSRRRTSPAFTYNIDIRELITNRFEPIRSGLFLNIRIGVHAQSVQVSVFNPPDGPLLEILQQVGILEVHVRHWTIEPTAVTQLTVVFRGIDVIVGSEHVIGGCELRELINPILVRQVLHPPVRCTAVIGHHVHQYFQAFSVRLLNHLCVEWVRTVARVDVIIIRASVAVVAPCFFVVT